MNKSIFSLCVSATILLCTCIAFWLREEEYVLTGDDLLYSFILDDKPLGSNTYDRKVTTVTDAIASQTHQYFFSNGRTLIHIPIQLFAGPWGKGAFIIVSTLMLASTILLFLCLTLPERIRKRPPLVLGAVVTFMYLFQNGSQLFYSIAGAFNYLYPMLTGILYLLLFRHFSEASGPRSGKFYGFILILSGIIAGWSQECFSLPLSAAVALYYLRLKKQREKVTRELRLLFYSLWCGTFIMCIAPGNFIRVINMGNPGEVFLRAMEYYCATPLFWLAVAALGAMRIMKKDSLPNFYRNNRVIIWSWTAACVMGCVVNTLPQSFSGIAFFSALVLFSSLSYFIRSDAESIRVTMLSMILAALFMYHQMMIVHDARRLARYHQEIIAQVNAEGHPLKLRKFQCSPYTAPFLNVWTESSIFPWIHFCMHAYYIGDITFPESLGKDSAVWIED